MDQKLYQDRGYLILPYFATTTEVKALRKRAKELLDAFDPWHRTVFNTDKERHISGDYFLDSGDKISFFFEPGALDEAGKLNCDKTLAVNKIGHALHALDPVFAKLTQSPKVSEIAYGLGYKRPVLVQSMMIFKQPGIGGKVNAHQDSSFLYTEPTSCCGLWIALEEATVENGCLWAIPGSHKEGVRTRFKRQGQKTYFDPAHWDDWDERGYVPLEVPAGTCIVLHGGLVHKSNENNSAVSRQAYSAHFIETRNTQYACDNWLKMGSGATFQPLLA
jgi:phytanoyl-CoA hydroxylase